MRLFRKTVALTLLTLYASFVVTLDLHHNHAVHLPGSMAPSLVSLEDSQFASAQQHAPCPVLQFSLAHAPGPNNTIHHTFDMVSLLVGEAICCDFRFYLTPSERAPPSA